MIKEFIYCITSYFYGTGVQAMIKYISQKNLQNIPGTAIIQIPCPRFYYKFLYEFTLALIGNTNKNIFLFIQAGKKIYNIYK